MTEKKVAASEGAAKREATERRERERAMDCERRRVVQLEDPRRHDRMREFNFLGLSIISSTRGFSSSSLARPAPPPSLPLLSIFFHPVLASSRLLAGSRFVILANDVPFFQQPVFSPVIRPHPQKSSPALRSTASPVSLITHEVIKIWQGDNFSNAAYTDFPRTKSETSKHSGVNADRVT